MGQVWRGTDVLLGRPVAVKVLRSEYTGDPSFLARFRAEAQNAAALSHPNIACVFDYGETAAQDGSGETLAYLVMELIEGRPLNEVIRASGGLDTETTLQILGQTASGLAEAHRAGMVHRDVKPGNILVTPDGDVKITDFGIAWSARSVALTQTGQVLGTPQYLSPEQAEGRQASPASDVYALGLIGYECLTGHAAFDGENAVTIALKQVREEPEPLPDTLPELVRALIRRTLAKDPAQRFPDGAAFLAAVEAVRAGRSIDPAPSTIVAPAVTTSSAVAARPSRSPSRRGERSRSHRAPAGTPAALPPRRRRRSSVAMVLLPLIGLLAGAGIAAMVLQGLAGKANPPAEAAAQQAKQDDGVLLVKKDYVGRPADEVALQLAALGLTVHRESRQNADADPGTVIGVRPAGQRLEPGATVVIVIATAPEVTTGGGAAPSAAPPAQTSAPAPKAVATSTTPSATETTPSTEAGSSTSATTSSPATATGTPTGSTEPSGTTDTTKPSTAGSSSATKSSAAKSSTSTKTSNATAGSTAGSSSAA
jgi:serine/threonine-protein kinase